MILIIRILFIIGCSLYGFLADISWLHSVSDQYAQWLGAGMGALTGILVLSLDIFFKKILALRRT